MLDVRAVSWANTGMNEWAYHIRENITVQHESFSRNNLIFLPVLTQHLRQTSRSKLVSSCQKIAFWFYIHLSWIPKIFLLIRWLEKLPHPKSLSRLAINHARKTIKYHKLCLDCSWLPFTDWLTNSTNWNAVSIWLYALIGWYGVSWLVTVGVKISLSNNIQQRQNSRDVSFLDLLHHSQNPLWNTKKYLLANHNQTILGKETVKELTFLKTMR